MEHISDDTIAAAQQSFSRFDSEGQRRMAGRGVTHLTGPFGEMIANDVLPAKAWVAATRQGLDLCSRLFEVTGARATHASLRLDRHWRNLRTQPCTTRWTTSSTS